MKSTIKTKPIYICDPKKMRLCAGQLRKDDWCGVKCFCTIDKQYAIDPEHPLTYEEYMKERDRRQKKCANTVTEQEKK